MSKTKKYSSLFVLVLVLGLLAGCFGGGSIDPKTYDLTVTVLDDATGSPLTGVTVELVGGALDARQTNTAGKVSFPKLKNTVELLIESSAFISQTKSVVMNKAQNITVRLVAVPQGPVVDTRAELDAALADLEVTSINLGQDLVLTTKLVIARPVALNLYGKTLTGDVEYDFEDEETLVLSGAGQLNGNLIINAPNATVDNRLNVTGTVSIADVASATWNEYATQNRLIILGSAITVNLYGGAQSIVVDGDTWGTRIRIHEGRVVQLTANADVYVSGGDRVDVATVNAPAVIFDLRPQTVNGDMEPTIIQSFVPGSGGTIQATSSSTPQPGTFAGLYVERHHCWPGFGSSTGHPEVDMYFPTPASLGGTGYKLQYLVDRSNNTWEQYSDVETSSANSNNFSITYRQALTFRLLMEGGPLDGYTSNEIEVPMTMVQTYWQNWGMTSGYGYVGETYTGYAYANKISDGTTVDTKYMSYQWYRVDPVTYEMEEIQGATTTQYTTQTGDAGKAIIFRASGDGENIAGYVQMWGGNGSDPLVIPNKAFITDVTDNGFTLNLHKNVPGLEKEQFEIYGSGPTAPNDPLEVLSVEFVPGSKAKLVVEVNIPAGLETLWVRVKTDSWGVVANYADDNQYPYIRDSINYQF